MAERTVRLLNADSLLSFALKSLSARSHSTGELRDKLRRRAEHSSDVDAVLSRLKELGYLDDRRFAEGFAAARLANQRLGRARVIQDLRQRRVAPAIAERTVARVYADADEESLIEDWIRRKYRLAPRDALFQEEKDLAAAYRRLRRAGFRSGEILRVLKRFAKDPELLDSFEPPEETVEE